MRRILTSLAAGVLVLSTSGCATLLGGGPTQAVSLRSDPAGATFVVRSSSGLQMSSGTAPQQITLSRKNEYEIEFSAPGYQTQRLSLIKGLNGWVWLNLVAGGVVGGAVDVISGAAWKLEPAIVDIKMVSAAGRDDSDVVLEVKMYDRKGTLLRELTVPMVPVDE